MAGKAKKLTSHEILFSLLFSRSKSRDQNIQKASIRYGANRNTELDFNSRKSTFISHPFQRYREEMLKPKVLSEVLSQANTDGVISTMLLNNEGSLLAYAGTNVNKDSKITAAVASNIWGAYEKNGKMAFNNEGLKFMFMDCDDGKVVVTKISTVLLCMYAQTNVGLGMLKYKMEKLADYLHEPLSSSLS